MKTYIYNSEEHTEKNILYSLNVMYLLTVQMYIIIGDLYPEFVHNYNDENTFKNIFSMANNIINKRNVIRLLILIFLVIGIKSTVVFSVLDASETKCLEYQTYNYSKNYSFKDAFSFKTSDGGSITVGTLRPISQGDSDIFLKRLDENGKMIFFYTYGSSGYEAVFSIIVTCDGGFLVSGSTTGFGAFLEDYFLLKIDPYGQELWHVVYGSNNSEWITNVTEILNVGYFVEGKMLTLMDPRENDPGCINICYLLFDYNGNLLWEKILD